ncbi:MAG: electron transfer flavoprotein subunit beta/FixA family protein [Planctomycetes bacterium]|nr:electron transfer flavoprotein subunit beta/FixA family protein [Planctomycetota bacterium]
MRILVVIRHVPDSRAAVTVLPDGSGVEHKGLKFVCNPFDEFAVEQATRLKESRSDIDEIVVACVGPAEAEPSIRAALAIGGDRAVHIRSDDSMPAHDDLAAARALSLWMQGNSDVQFDLILCGKQAIDTDVCDFGPAFAEYLDLPHVGAIVGFELSDDGQQVTVRRRVGGAEEVVAMGLPCLATCDRGLNEPRNTPLPKVMQARKKPLESVRAGDIAGLSDWKAGTAFVQLSPPAEKEPCTVIEGEPEEMARELVRVLREEAKVI